MGMKALCVAMVTQAVILGGFAQPSNVTAEELQSGLRYELKPLAQTFVEIEEEYGINSTLYSSIVAIESGWGRSDLSANKNNITSFTTAGGYKSYESKEDCLWDMARNLSENYLDEDGIYYNGSAELEDVACYYLLGKPRSEMTYAEKKQTDQYIDIVTGIQDGIISRIDNHRSKNYNGDNGVEND